jgi:hypothetical protein
MKNIMVEFTIHRGGLCGKTLKEHKIKKNCKIIPVLN